MPSLIHSQETEVSILTHLAIFRAVDQEWSVAGGVEFRGVRVVNRKRNRFATEPVADVVCVPVDKGDSDTGGKKFFEVREEGWVHEVACVGERIGDGGVGRRGVV